MVRSLPHPAGMRLPRPHPVFVHRWATPRVIALVILIRCSGSDGTVPLWAAELALHTLYAARAQHRKRADCDSAHDRPPCPAVVLTTRMAAHSLPSVHFQLMLRGGHT